MIAHQQDANKRGANGNFLARAAGDVYSDAPSATTQPMGAGSVTIGNAGGSIPIGNFQPTEVIRYCVATVGVFPSRN